MTRTYRYSFFATSAFSSPALAGAGYMGVSVDSSLMGMLFDLSLYLTAVVFAFALLIRIVDEIKKRK